MEKLKVPSLSMYFVRVDVATYKNQIILWPLIFYQILGCLKPSLWICQCPKSRCTANQRALLNNAVLQGLVANLIYLTIWLCCQLIHASLLVWDCRLHPPFRCLGHLGESIWIHIKSPCRHGFLLVEFKTSNRRNQLKNLEVHIWVWVSPCVIIDCHPRKDFNLPLWVIMRCHYRTWKPTDNYVLPP